MHVVLVAACMPIKGLPQTFHPRRVTGRIVGGEDVDIRQIPYQVSLLYNGRYNCGGAIISTKFIVTGAICTHEKPASSLSVRAGSSLIESGGVVIPVLLVFQHPKFNEYTMDYDFSVVELGSFLTFGETIAKVLLPLFPLQDPLDGLQAIASGWGAVDESSGVLSNQLQSVQLEIVGREACRAAFTTELITDRMVCAGVESGGKDACHGDSGSPLVQYGTLVGIVSWGLGCGHAKYPGVYAGVGYQRNFISEVTGI